MTISYNRLGSNGRLGNQMFQYSGFRGIASHKGYDWLIPPEDADSTCNYGLFDCFKMTNVSVENKGFGLSNWQTTNLRMAPTTTIINIINSGGIFIKRNR